MVGRLQRWLTSEQIARLSTRPLFGPRGIRRELGEIDFGYFREAYFGHWMTDEAGRYVPPAEFHDELAEELERVVRGPGGELEAWAAPRGYAKSTTLLIFVAWCVLYERVRYIQYVMDTYDQAKLQLEGLKSELESNPSILEDFGEIAGEKIALVWQEGAIVTSTGIRVEILGTRMKIRGRRYKKSRPGLIIVDDPENDEHVVTPEQRDKNWRWFWRSLMKSGHPRTNVFVIGTIIHYDCLVARLLGHHRAKSRKYRAVLQEAEREDLWQKWAAIYTDLTLPDREERAREFYEANREEMDRGAVVLWPEREDYYALRVERLDDPLAFASEKQNEPVNLEDAVFDETRFRVFPEPELNEYDIYGAVDPSLGKKGKRGDYSAIIDLGVHKKTGQKLVLDADVARRPPDKIIEDILAKAEGYARRGNRYRAFGVETTQFQEFFKDILANRSQKARVYLPIVEVSHTTDKVIRIQRLQPEIHNGYIAFVERLRNGLLWQQLKFFPFADHDDGPDALEMANSIVSRPLDEGIKKLLRGASMYGA